MVYLLFHDFVEKYDKVLKSLGTAMVVVFSIFMLYVTMASIMASILNSSDVNYTVLLSSLIVTFVILYWFIKVAKTFQ
jgi:antibiotic biosynthesis monooxygenase (ABM) superfamily enzyme